MSPTQPLTFLGAAELALEHFDRPCTPDKLTEWALANNLITTAGRTPVATMEAQMASSIKRHGDASPFVRTAPRTYALRRWVAEGKVSLPPAQPDDIRIVFYPDYDEVRLVLPVLAGLPRAQVTGLRAAMWEHRGTTADNVDWTDPDTWIPARLSGDNREVALRIWKQTRRRVNPRHMAGHWLLASGYELVADGPKDVLVVTDRGREFLAHPEGAAVRELDQREGLLALLALVAEQGAAARRTLLEPWMEHARRVSRIRAESTARSFLYYRLRNLVARGYVARLGQKYEITPTGLSWLKESTFAEVESTAPDETRRLWDLAKEQRDAVRSALREQLSSMQPYAFEGLVGRLLQEMGYTDVEVTSPSGDKGVDVLGTIALGITEVREVIQVKRQQGNVRRQVLDMLRGSLHRFKAVKGTIITLGNFAQGARDAAFELGAAPITLIDGDKLLDLLIDNSIGVRTKTLELLELDTASLQLSQAESGMEDDAVDS
jgi:restriction system protein